MHSMRIQARTFRRWLALSAGIATLATAPAGAATSHRLSLGTGLAWYFSDRDHQVGTNNMPVYEAEYLYGSRFPVGAHYQLSDAKGIGKAIWDTFRSLSLVAGSRLTGGSFQAEALAGIGWAKGTD